MIHIRRTLVNAERDFANSRMGDSGHVETGAAGPRESIDIVDRVTIAMRSMLLTQSNAGEGHERSAAAGPAPSIGPGLLQGCASSTAKTVPGFLSLLRPLDQ